MIFHRISKSTKSYWHDVMLFYRDTVKTKMTIPGKELIDQTYQMVVEIEADTREKMEVSKEIEYNPIVLDRYLKSPMPFIYGSLPQTYEDPKEQDPIMKIKGDDDPLDVCNMSNVLRRLTNMPKKLHHTGNIIPVKVIGILQIKDTGEADWKVIGVDYDLFSSYIENYDEVSSQIKNVFMTWFNSDPKYEDVAFFDVLNPDPKVSDNSIRVFNTVMSHSIKSYGKLVRSTYGKLINN